MCVEWTVVCMFCGGCVGSVTDTRLCCERERGCHWCYWFIADLNSTLFKRSSELE